MSSSVPSYSALTYNLTEYDLEFDAKITRGGLIWSTSYNFGIRSKEGILINLASKYPEESTFLNTNKTLFPPIYHHPGVWSKLCQPDHFDLLRARFVLGAVRRTRRCMVPDRDHHPLWTLGRYLEPNPAIQCLFIHLLCWRGLDFIFGGLWIWRMARSVCPHS